MGEVAAVATPLVAATSFAQVSTASDLASSPPSAAATATAAETGLAALNCAKLIGRHTASGQTYDPNKLTAAYKTPPLALA
jgi:rare lipoprotein A (peptidoglycan hydrolase)